MAHMFADRGHGCSLHPCLPLPHWRLLSATGPGLPPPLARPGQCRSCGPVSAPSCQAMRCWSSAPGPGLCDGAGVELTSAWPAVEEWVGVPSGGFVRRPGGRCLAVPLSLCGRTADQKCSSLYTCAVDRCADGAVQHGPTVTGR